MDFVVTIPVYNEEKILEENTIKLLNFLKKKFTDEIWEIIISDNNSSDNTSKIGKALAQAHEEIGYFFVQEQGKGSAVVRAWQSRQADIYTFMDADLATHLDAFPGLLAAVRGGDYDVACGSRFLKGSSVNRSILRKCTSLGYRALVKVFLGIKTKDLPCGFKAVTKKVVDEIIPQVQDGGWFFDSELIILSEKNGFKIKEIPVQWREPVETGRKSKVKIWSLSKSYVKKILQMKRRLNAE